MKRVILLTVLTGLCAAFCFAQSGTLDMALSNASSYIEAELPRGSRVLITEPASPTTELSVYAAQEISGRLVNDKKVTIVERSADVIGALKTESGYQLSGEVSDDTIQSIGHKTGAEVIITGSIHGTGEKYRLTVKVTSVESAELIGQYSVFFQPDTVFNSLIASSLPVNKKPDWTFEPLSARTKYEKDGSISGTSLWFYDVGVSNKAASEQLARTRARQNIQQVIAENIASDIRARIDLTSASLSSSSSIEDTESLFQLTLVNSIKTRVPSYETLEWYIENGNTDGKNWYMVYVLVRFVRKEIIASIEKIEPAKVIDIFIRDAARRPGGKIELVQDEKDELIRQLREARDRAIEIIDAGIGNN